MLNAKLTVFPLVNYRWLLDSFWGLWQVLHQPGAVVQGATEVLNACLGLSLCYMCICSYALTHEPLDFSAGRSGRLMGLSLLSLRGCAH